MAYVTVPKDLDRIKNKVAFNLTMRQVVCLGIAAAIGAPFYFAARDILGTSNAATGMVALMLPVFFFALYEKDGLPLEKVLMNMINVRFIRPAERKFNKTGNGKTVKEGLKISDSKRRGKQMNSKAVKDDGKKRTAIKRNETTIAEEINENMAEEGKRDVVVLSFEHPDGDDKDRVISGDFILKEMAGKLNGMEESQAFFETENIEGNAVTSKAVSDGKSQEEDMEMSIAGSDADKQQTEDSLVSSCEKERSRYILYEPLTTQEAYLNSLLENLGGGVAKV